MERRLYDHVKELLIEELAGSQPGQRLPSRAALAERFGVNRTTVERAVSELIGEGLLYARDKSGTYTTGRLPAARHAEGGRRWAVVIPDIQHDTYPGIIRGIQDTAGGRGIDVILSNTDNSVRRQTACLERFLEGGTDGIILIPAVYEGTDLRPLMRILERRVPLVLCNREVPGIQAPVVKSDNFLGGKLAVRHLVSTGRRRIAYVSPPIYQTSAERYQGYLAALAENGLEQDPSLVSFACAPGEPENALRAVTRLLQRRADGVFCFNDAAACVVYDAAARLGRKVGRELAVVGYDNTPLCEGFRPKLTTVDFRTYEVGRRAAELICAMTEGDESARRRSVVVEPSLIVRESTPG